MPMTGLIFFILDLLSRVSLDQRYSMECCTIGLERLDESGCCEASAWFDHSPTFDFHTKNASRCIWGLPLLVLTCPKKLFEQGSRKKYVDIVADTLHASSSDLITSNTLVTKKLQWQEVIPDLRREIAAASLDDWQSDRARKSQPGWSVESWCPRTTVAT